MKYEQANRESNCRTKSRHNTINSRLHNRERGAAHWHRARVINTHIHTHTRTQSSKDYILTFAPDRFMGPLELASAWERQRCARGEKINI